MEKVLTRWEFTFPAQTTEREFSKFIVFYINLSRHHEGESLIPEIRVCLLGREKAESIQTEYIIGFTKTESGVIAETHSGNRYRLYEDQMSGQTKRIIDDLTNRNELDTVNFRTYT